VVLGKRVATTAILLTLAASLVGCAGEGKFSEQFKDAGVDSRDTSSAEIGTMPDGFSNFATKCNNGNRVYVLFHNDNPYGGIAVVPNDTTCSEIPQ